jgi:hypothetical protein
VNSQHAREILALFRPGTADAADPDFAEALEQVRRDPELNRWFDEHCRLYTAIRTKFKRTPVPEGLKEQILAERRVHLPGFWRRPKALAASALVLTALVISVTLWWPPREDTGFPAYQVRMTRFAMRDYGMPVETNNLAVIQAYLSTNGAPTGYTLPGGLSHATPTGCALPTWRGSPVAMFCFKSGKPLPPGGTSDIFLFVADRRSVGDAPSNLTITSLDNANPVTMAAWTSGDKVYLLAGLGDEAFLKQYL